MKFGLPRPEGLLLLVNAGQVATEVINITIPKGLETRILPRDVVGYSIEPTWVDTFIRNSKTATLLSAIANITGIAPPIRIGGNTADQTYLQDMLPSGHVSEAFSDPGTTSRFNVTRDWFRTWGDYFPPGTNFIYTLNFADNTSSWKNAVEQAEAAYAGLGDKLSQFELGNEIDHFINKSWRPPYPSWGVAVYIEQFRNLTGQITSSAWYKQLSHPPTFQAGVIADPPLVEDQQDEIDDFSIANLTANGTGGLLERPEDRALISSLAVHLYPQSTCDAPRWNRMRLDLLSNHSTLWLNVSQFIPEIEAADHAGIPFIMGETNSVSCGGRSGISDTFGAALWVVDYVLLAASLGMQKIFFHLGAQSEYSAFTPEPYFYKNESLTAGIRATWYSHYFLAKAVASSKNETFRIAALPSANSSTLAGYGIYAGVTLKKLVFVDMGVWNGTKGLSNPSTISSTDGNMFSNTARSSNTLTVFTPWAVGQNVAVTRLSGPGTNSKSEILVSGVAFDMGTGMKIGDEASEALYVGISGQLNISIARAEAVLLEVEQHL
ncbi:hypothetical protein BT63DRAFT_454296 [Microthyrium microscopicum]|uniref:Beta-glucuronidase C-terminal domain-containing protein n=1 Tax=Microthyrium microscopicum TaxID=703497 RepID=A0A6A6UF56_9PEZI|nr:hypothetical protein BT63DRAFT_454296 [Microthyrium microscopicum]